MRAEVLLLEHFLAGLAAVVVPALARLDAQLALLDLLGDQLGGRGRVAQPREDPARYGGADVQADHVVHFHGAQAGEAEAGAGLDGGVQVLGSADAFVEDEGALAGDGAHDPVDDEARHLLAHERGLLARLLHHALGQLVGGVGGLGAAMDLYQRDDVRGVEVVDADDGRGVGHALGQGVHRHAAGVAADDHVRVHGLDGADEGPLVVQVLADGLHYVVHPSTARAMSVVTMGSMRPTTCRPAR